MTFTYGVIEGLYDPAGLWTWSARQAYPDFCHSQGLQFYLYAPKNDPYLREQWQDPWPEDDFEQLKRLSQAFKKQGVAFGIGLTPFAVQTLNQATRQALKRKLALINAINPTVLCVLFDDFKNDIPNLAQTQATIAEYIAAHSTATRFLMVGTWYSKDPLLNRVYGPMPTGYWSDLGRCLDARFDLFWTGDYAISPGYDQAGLAPIAEQFKRKPFLWDNYPVNDTAWLQDRLRLYAFTGRPWQLCDWTSGHAANPLIQPYLSMIPLATLAALYRQKAQFIAHRAFMAALSSLCGDELATAIRDNLVHLSEEGRNHFSAATRQRLTTLFQAFRTPAQRPFIHDISQWLDGGEKPVSPPSA